VSDYSSAEAFASASSWLSEVDDLASLAEHIANDALNAAVYEAIHADDDQTFTLTTSSPSITEGDSGTKTLTYVVTLDEAPLTAVTVNYVTSSSGTADGDDFSSVAGVLSFAIGQTSATVSVTVNGDTTVESNETVGITFSGTQLVASVTATGTIVNNDVDTSAEAQTFTLTAESDDFLGGSGDDTFTATSGNFGDDVLDGAEGADTLVGYIAAAITPMMSNIETVDLISRDAEASFDMTDVSDVDTINVSGNNDLDIIEIDAEEILGNELAACHNDGDFFCGFDQRLVGEPTGQHDQGIDLALGE
jgi:hypothetical protein